MCRLVLYTQPFAKRWKLFRGSLCLEDVFIRIEEDFRWKEPRLAEKGKALEGDGGLLWRLEVLKSPLAG